MAKCDLAVELDEPQQIHSGGGRITGVVRVTVDSDVNCSGLEVKSVWRTHGRGNVASGEFASLTLFSGGWQAGEAHEYRFELPVGQWPPTYHGHYLNIDHYIDARANIPWAFDPKASTPFLMQPTGGAEVAKVASKVTEVKGVCGCLVGVFFLLFMLPFAVALFQAGPFALLFLLIPLAIFGFWLVRYFLPKFVLGDVQYRFAAENVSPGEQVTGELIIRPRKNVSINGVRLDFQAREQCVSGSGSNRTTHKYVFFEKSETLGEASVLTAGSEHRFPLSVRLPDDAPYSVDLDDNDLIWSAKLRVDIPRWPDWVKEIPLQVVPAANGISPAAVPTIPAAVPLPSSPSGAATAAPMEDEGGITFGETANHLWAVRDNRQQVEMLVEAVSGLTFELEAEIERRLLYSGEDDPHLYPDGYAVWAHYPDPELPLVLYVPHELADEFEQVGRENWRGRGTVVGWDGLHGRLQVKLEPPS